MTEKKDSKNTQTKAGMLGKEGSPAESERDETASEESSGNTPKISKNEAEGRRGDEPLH
jgi:hypothetical protein